MKIIINNNKKSIIGMKPSVNQSTSKCQNKEASTLNGQYQIGEAVYKATLSSSQPIYKRKYFGIVEESLKGRLFKHNLSFRNEFYKNDTELSKEV